jgi:steroid 5-alpha reductase family enzyme
LIQIIAVSATTVLLFMTVMYIIAQIKKNNSIVDIGWGIGFILIALLLMLISKNLNIKDLFLFAMILAWGLRLAFHVYFRSRGKEEDFRYAQWRRDWGKNAVVIAFFKVFLLQGIIMLIIAYPIMVVFSSIDNQLTIINIFGISIFLFGLLFESIGDYQLFCFKRDPLNKGKIITSGLWKFTRHPNYFGEVVLWWGIGIFAIGSDLYLTAFISPLILNLLLLYVSGVPMLEKKYAGKKDWEDYKKITPTFVPLIGRKG